MCRSGQRRGSEELNEGGMTGGRKELRGEERGVTCEAGEEGRKIGKLKGEGRAEGGSVTLLLLGNESASE